MSKWIHGVRPLTVVWPLAVAVACATAGTPAPRPAEAQAQAAPSEAGARQEAQEVQEARVVASAPQPASTEQVVAPPAAEAPPARKPHGRVQGIDISHYQPTVDWDTVKSSIAFVFIKATDSTSGVDPRFSTHWSGAKKAGLPRGAYHFFHPKHDVATQASNFTRHLKPDPGELPPVIDVEEFKDEYKGYTCEQLAGMVQRFSQAVEKELGRKPMIYTNHQTWKESFCSHPYFLDHALWLAQYTQHPEPRLPEGWKQWSFWQYTESGKVAGIPGQVDQSYFNGSIEELKALLAGAKK